MATVSSSSPRRRSAGLRSYVAARMLAGHGFAGVSHLAGGLRFYDIVTGDARLIERATPCGADAC